MQGTKQETTTAHKIKPENILLALDIGTEFVKAVIAEKTSDDNLNIIGVAKEHQSMGNMYAGAIASCRGNGRCSFKDLCSGNCWGAY